MANLFSGLKGSVSNKVNNAINSAFPLSASITEQATLLTDYAKSSKNSALQATIGLATLTDDGARAPLSYITGYLTQGFGWSLSNNYEELLPMTELQRQATRGMQGIGAVANTLGIGEGVLGDLPGKLALSLQQTVSVWMGMNKPNFSINVLFFDSRGESNTSVTTASYIIERALHPYVNTLSQNDFNLLMTAPGGYTPTSRGGSAVNKTYGLTAEGLSSLNIGGYISFPEIILTGASFTFSDIILNNGKPQWMTATLNFSMWRQPLLTDLQARYT